MPLRPLTAGTLLAAVLVLDGLLALGFGLASWWAPMATFGTIVDIRGAGAPGLVLAALSSLSILYVVVGLVCLVAATLPPVYRRRLALVMAVNHAWAGAKGLHEVGQAWLIGNPWPDIAIHSTLVVAYALLVTLGRMRDESAAAPVPAPGAAGKP